jgi:iron complex outermembrane receptor protein
MKNITKFALLTSISVMVFADQAWAQSEPQADGEDEIVVTALRRDQKLQDAPAIVSVFSEKTIETTGARVAGDFVALTSGVTLSTGATEPNDTLVNIRGLYGVRDGEGNVALVVDGVLKPSRAEFNEPQGPLKQVEVLKGPQGAIYGRSASSGAIVITTQKPTDYLSGEIKLSGAEDNTQLASGTLTGPIADNFGFVVSAEYSKTDGYHRNTFLGTPLAAQTYPGNSTNTKSVDSREKISLFGRLYYDDGNTVVDAKANFANSKFDAISYNAVFHLPGLAAAFNEPLFDLPVSQHQFVFTNNLDPQGWYKAYGASLRIEQQLEFAKLIGVASYTNNVNDFVGGGTSGAFGFFDNEPTCIASRAATDGNVENQEPFTTYAAIFGYAQPYSPTTCDGHQVNRRSQKDVVTEVRLVSLPGGPLQWQLGANYIYIDRRTCINLTLDTGAGGVRECYSTDPRFQTEALQDDTYTTDVYALFGSVDYDATDRLKLGVALRYDIEARDVVNNVPVNARTRWVGNPSVGVPHGTATTPADYYLNPGLDPIYNPLGSLPPRSATFKQLQPKVTLSYKAADAAIIYASWGIGFKAGGFNAGGNSAIIDLAFNEAINSGIIVPDTYNKERDSAFELGVKGTLFNGLDYELAAYRTDVTDMHFFEFFVGSFGLLRSISNIDKVGIKGLEGSLNLRVSPSLSLFASANVIDTKIKKFKGRPYTIGNKAPSTPDYQITGGAQFDQSLTDNLSFFARADFQVTGPTPYHPVQDNLVPTIFMIDANMKNSTRDTFTLVNARTGVQFGDLRFTAFASNIFDKNYVNDVVPAPEFGGDFVAPGTRRRLGLEVSYKF